MFRGETNTFFKGLFSNNRIINIIILIEKKFIKKQQQTNKQNKTLYMYKALGKNTFQYVENITNIHV